MVAPLRTIALAASALLLLAGCGSSNSSSTKSGSSPTLTITSPGDGAQVGSSFVVKWNASVQLGSPDTGRDHVHVFVDGKSGDYTVVGGNEYTLKGLTPGEHKVDVTLQHADHSPAGAQDVIEVYVGGSSSSMTPTPTPTSSSSSGTGYGY